MALIWDYYRFTISGDGLSSVLIPVAGKGVTRDKVSVARD